MSCFVHAAEDDDRFCEVQTTPTVVVGMALKRIFDEVYTKSKIKGWRAIKDEQCPILLTALPVSLPEVHCCSLAFCPTFCTTYNMCFHTASKGE